MCFVRFPILCISSLEKINLLLLLLYVVRDDGKEKPIDFQRLYRRWGVRGFDMMAEKLGGRQMLKLVMRKTKLSHLDHAKLLVWNELNPVKEKFFD